MNKKPAGGPIVLELAPMPRDQVGPFLLLGIDKSADKDQIEANWAQRVIWARKSQIKTALEDVNWAREVIRDPDRRVRDNAERVLGRLQRSAGRRSEWGRAPNTAA